MSQLGTVGVPDFPIEAQTPSQDSPSAGWGPGPGEFWGRLGVWDLDWHPGQQMSACRPKWGYLHELEEV